MWLSRFDGGTRPQVGIADSPALFPDWDIFRIERRATDARIVDWATALGPERLAGDLHWFSGASGRAAQRPMALCVVHFFNHQTHHRGQIHAMLTAAGAKPGVTDLVFMPETLE
jgi:uncharacterized damage-inducible protein DinB